LLHHLLLALRLLLLLLQLQLLLLNLRLQAPHLMHQAVVLCGQLALLVVGHLSLAWQQRAGRCQRHAAEKRHQRQRQQQTAPAPPHPPAPPPPQRVESSSSGGSSSSSSSRAEVKCAFRQHTVRSPMNLPMVETRRGSSSPPHLALQGAFRLVALTAQFVDLTKKESNTADSKTTCNVRRRATPATHWTRAPIMGGEGGGGKGARQT
jgi:hypothetical protein